MGIEYRISPPLTDDQLNGLFFSAWEGHARTDFSYLERNSLVYVCCFDGKELIGFVNLAWDGGKHAFLLDTTVRKERQRQGIGSALVGKAMEYAASRNIEWVHVDYEPHLAPFYEKCGFRETRAGLFPLAGNNPR